MNIKCHGCGNALRYDIISGKLKCEYCGTDFYIEDVQGPDLGKYTGQPEKETIEYQVYCCTSCGAELALNGAESSTFCAYCGQPTIIFERVIKALRPHVIIPFKIHRQQALLSIRRHLNCNFFAPKEIRCFKSEQLTGVYIPYWLFDGYIRDKLSLEGNPQKRRIRKFRREAECFFEKMPLDASRILPDDISQRLEPYNMEELEPFHIGYMQGFYADYYDVSNGELRNDAADRMKKMFDKEMIKHCSFYENLMVMSNKRVKVRNEKYAMLPVWFLTVRLKEQPYTILVNGQTGKVVGGVPYDKKKIFLWGAIIFLGISPFIIRLCTHICEKTIDWTNGDSTILFFLALLLGIGVPVLIGRIVLFFLKDRIQLTAGEKMAGYVHDRREKSE